MFNPSTDDFADLYDMSDGVAKTEEAPQSMQPDEEAAPVEEPNQRLEDYSTDDMDKVEVKGEDITTELSDKDLEQEWAKPKADKKKKKKAKESKEEDNHPLYLCNECCKTFRNAEAVCLLCESKDVTTIARKLVEGVSELIGEVEGVSMKDQAAVRDAIKKGAIDEEWPAEEVMIDQLSKLEDIVPPEEEDIKIAYLKYVIVPKALSVAEAKVEEQEDGVVVKLTRPLFNIPTSRRFPTEEEAISWTRKLGLSPNQFEIMSEESKVEEQEEDEMAQDHDVAKRKAELEAQKAKMEAQYHEQMDRLNQEIERLGEE